MRKFSCMDGFLQEDFNSRSKRESNPRARIRLLGLHYLQLYQNYSQVGELLGVKRHTVRGWQHRYEQEGMAGLLDKPGRGNKCRIKEDEQAQLANAIIEAHETRQGGRMNVHMIRALVKEAVDQSYSPSGMYGLLRRIGLSWITARSQHPKTDIAKQEAFKKTS